jgi:hypothetical protein
MPPAVGAAGPGRARWSAALPLLALLALLAADLLGPARSARAGGPPPDRFVPAMVAAFGGIGTLAVAVAPVQRRVSGPGIRAIEAHEARLRRLHGSNGAAGRPFPSASTVKLFVAEDLLHQARTGRVTLSDDDRGLLLAMIRRSDDDAASALWVRFGGGRMVTDVAARYGLRGTAPPVRPGQWGETTTTARDLAAFLSRLPVVAHPEDAATLLFWMRTATPAAADGFDQRYGLLGPVPGRPAVKQGWMCCLAGVRYLHSVGVVGHRVVVLLSAVPRAVSYEVARAGLDAAAAALPPPPRP